MRTIFLLCCVLVTRLVANAQSDSLVFPAPQTEDLQFLVAEVLMNNPEIAAATHQMDVMEARIPQAGALADPELTFMREEMPGFRYRDAMYSRLELMQTFRFPTKLSSEGELAALQAEHAHHTHLERINEVLSKLKWGYFELWFVQQSTILAQENIRLMKQFLQIALSKYANGQASQADVFKSQIELARMSNELISLRQQEVSAKAMLMALLNRTASDTIGYAVIPEEVTFTPNIDTLRNLALGNRPMLVHDSLSIIERRTMYRLSKQEYLPDFKLGIQYVTLPTVGANAWTLTAGITLPFAPWVLGKANARTEEAVASIEEATASYNASKNMVLSTVSDLYAKVTAAKQQLETFDEVIIPQARRALSTNLTAYETGTTNFLMLIDSYRTVVDLTKEYFMVRMQFEQAIAELEKTVGVLNIASLK